MQWTFTSYTGIMNIIYHCYFVSTLKVYRDEGEVDTSSAQWKWQLMMTSLSEHRQVRYWRKSMVWQRELILTLAILRQRPWNLLRNSTIHFHISSYYATYLLSITVLTPWQLQFIEIFRPSSLIWQGKIYAKSSQGKR